MYYQVSFHHVSFVPFVLTTPLQTRPQVVVNSLGDDQVSHLSGPSSPRYSTILSFPQRYPPSITPSSEGVTMIKHTVSPFRLRVFLSTLLDTLVLIVNEHCPSG